MYILETKNLTKKYMDGDKEIIAINDLSLKVRENEIVAIMGRSGSGKTTLLNIIGKFDSPTKGKIFLEGKDITKLSEKEEGEYHNKKIGYIVQNFALIPDYTVFENVCLPLEYNKNIKKKAYNLLVDKMLAKVELSKKKHTVVSELSGGQKQRVAIARALINNPKIVLADEPTGALDSNTADSIINLFKLFNKSKTTFIIVTHDQNIARLCDRTIIISDGSIV